MITSPQVALTAMLMNNTVIAGIVGKMNGGVIPFIKYGIIAESEGNLPAIGCYINVGESDQVLRNYVFTVNCYAGNSLNQLDAAQNSLDLALAVIEEFNECDSGIDGYFARTTCSIIASIPDPSANQVNTPMSFRIVNM